MLFGRFHEQRARWGKASAAPEENYAEERACMVRDQIERRGVNDPRVLEAMRSIPRHCFLPEEWAAHAYDDRPIEIGCGQTISQPYMVALMTQLLELKPADHVLEVGTGSGYQCAILATLAAQVISIERIEALAAHAAATLDVLGFDNATVFVGDGTRGRAEFAPYDAIVVTAGGPCVPASLKAQLADGGRLVCPIGSHDTQELVRLTRRGDAFHEQRGTACVFVPLIGAEGWAQ